MFLEMAERNEKFVAINTVVYGAVAALLRVCYGIS